MTAMQNNPLSNGRLVAARQEIRATLDAEEAQWKARKKALEADLEAVEWHLIDRVNQRGEPIRLDDGTSVQRTTNVFVTVTDWDAFHAYILETGNLSLLQQNAGRNEVVKAIEARIGGNTKVVDYFNGKKPTEALPPFIPLPGVELQAEYLCKINKPKE